MRLSWLVWFGLGSGNTDDADFDCLFFFDRMSRVEALDALLAYELYHLFLVCGMCDCLVSFRIALADST